MSRIEPAAASGRNRRALISWAAGAALIGTLMLPGSSLAPATLPAITATQGPDGGQTYSLSVQTLLLLPMLSFLTAMLLIMTGFTRLILVLGLFGRNSVGGVKSV